MENRLFIRLAISIPIVNILMDMIMIFFPDLKSQIGILRTSYLLFIILYFILQYGLEKTRYNILLLFYLLFILVMTLQTTDLQESLIDGFLKMSVSFFMIPVGIQLGKAKNTNIIKSLYFVLVILIINYIISQVYKIGVSTYHEDSFYQGGASVTAPIIIAAILLVFFNSYNTNRLPYSRFINLFIVSASVFIILISLKRGAILGFLAGVLIYLLVSSKKVGTVFRLALIAISIFIFSNEYSDTLQKRIDARSTERNEIQNENRYKETFYVIEELSQSNLYQILFGTEAFNSKSVMKKYFGRERQLHVDYNILLHGTGVLGLLFYFYLFYMYGKMAWFINRTAKTFDDVFYKNLIGENYSLIISLIALSMVMSISGGLQFASYRVILLFILGFFLGQMIRLRNEKMSLLRSIQPEEQS